jgi:putative ABC transport system ATP-binding protein
MKATHRNIGPESHPNTPGATSRALIEAEGLSKWVDTSEGTLHILTAVDLSIKSGETVAVVGASGSGKSTLIGLLAGLDAPSAGRIHVDGLSLSELSEDGRAEVRRRLIGFVFQSFQLIPSLNALENAMLPLELAGRRSARDEAAAMLERVGLQHRLKHYPRQLSGGEQQRVALARAFVTEPKILFADEPTGNLDRSTGQGIIELMLRLNTENRTTLILVTHDNALAERCERIVRLEAGRVLGAEGADR